MQVIRLIRNTNIPGDWDTLVNVTLPNIFENMNAELLLKEGKNFKTYEEALNQFITDK